MNNYLVQDDGPRSREFCPSGSRNPCAGVTVFAGLSPESQFIQSRVREVIVHYLRPVSRLNDDPYACFCSLAASWRENVKHLSDTNEICMEEHYQQIIGMGEPALAFIFSELREDIDHWFWALKAITRQDPVPEEHRGRMKIMREYWLAWASRHGY
jgi:hypothetical protein